MILLPEVEHLEVSPPEVITTNRNAIFFGVFVNPMVNKIKTRTKVLFSKPILLLAGGPLERLNELPHSRATRKSF